MAINPPSDIVLDVINAAPARMVDAAKARLASMADLAAGAPSFESRLEAAAPPVKGGGETPEAFVKFEAMMLESFLQYMLPSDHASVYGDGLAGDMWQQMLARQVAGVMAEAGGIGVADRLLKDYYMQGDERVAVSGVTQEAARAEDAEQRLVTESLLHETRRLLTQPLLNEAKSSLFDQ